MAHFAGSLRPLAGLLNAHAPPRLSRTSHEKRHFAEARIPVRSAFSGNEFNDLSFRLHALHVPHDLVRGQIPGEADVERAITTRATNDLGTVRIEEAVNL